MSTPETETPAVDAGRPLDDEQIAGQTTIDGDTIAPAPKRSRSRARKPAAEGTAKPKRERAPRSSSRPRATPLSKRVQSLHETAGLGLSFVPQPWAQPAGMALMQNAEDIGKAWEQLAKDNPRVAEALERILTVSTVGQLLAAYMPVALAVLASSGRLGGMTGFPGPTVVPDPTPGPDSPAFVPGLHPVP